jgi:hypothetical protein
VKLIRCLRGQIADRPKDSTQHSDAVGYRAKDASDRDRAIAMNEYGESLRLDYEQTVEVVRMLTDVRFKLLALVPTVSALGVVIAKDRSLGDATGIAIVGALATIGLLVYELRNSQLYAAAMHRAKDLEKRMGLQCSNLGAPITELANGDVAWSRGGVFEERPYTLRFVGVLVKHDRALALVYAAAMTGWVYVLSSAILPIVLEGKSLATLRGSASVDPDWLPVAIALVAGVLTALLIYVFDRRGDTRDSQRPDHLPPRLVSVLIHSGNTSKISTAEALRDANRPARAKPPAPSG